jgi:hypothetical protein
MKVWPPMYVPFPDVVTRVVIANVACDRTITFNVAAALVTVRPDISSLPDAVQLITTGFCDAADAFNTIVKTCVFVAPPFTVTRAPAVVVCTPVYAPYVHVPFTSCNCAAPVFEYVARTVKVCPPMYVPFPDVVTNSVMDKIACDRTTTFNVDEPLNDRPEISSDPVHEQLITNGFTDTAAVNNWIVKVCVFVALGFTLTAAGLLVDCTPAYTP